MKAVILEADAVDHGDLSWEPVTSVVETKVYGNTTEENKYDHIGNAEIVFVNKIRMDAEVFDRCPDIRYIGVCATGYNVIDMDAARMHNVTVTYVPAYSTESVAQLTWGMILETVCHISLHNESVHKGDWVKSDIFCYWLAPVTELAGKTIGIVGYGNIGRRVCEIARAFHMNVLVNTAHPEKYEEDNKDDLNISFTDMDTLLSRSDIISLHCPLTKETERIINKNNIEKMKDGVIIINVSRGGLVVEEDLTAALENGKVAGAAVDVVSIEPMREDNPLLNAPNIVITPHMGWASVDARKRLIDVVACNLKAFLEGRKENIAV